MRIRQYQANDIEQCFKLGVKYNINLPNDGSVMVAQDDSGNVKAFMIVRPIIIIEPFISENPLAGKKLFESFIEALKLTSPYKMIRANIDPENKQLLEKLGFDQVFEDKIQMEKLF